MASKKWRVYSFKSAINYPSSKCRPSKLLKYLINSIMPLSMSRQPHVLKIKEDYINQGSRNFKGENLSINWQVEVFDIKSHKQKSQQMPHNLKTHGCHQYSSKLMLIMLQPFELHNLLFEPSSIINNQSIIKCTCCSKKMIILANHVEKIILKTN